MLRAREAGGSVDCGHISLLYYTLGASCYTSSTLKISIASNGRLLKKSINSEVNTVAGSHFKTPKYDVFHVMFRLHIIFHMTFHGTWR